MQKKKGYMFPLGIELSSEMFTLLISMISGVMAEVRGGNNERFSYSGASNEFSQCAFETRSQFKSKMNLKFYCKEKSQDNLKSMIFDILGSEDSVFDNVLEIAAEICTSSLELFVPGWEEKVKMLCQIMQPSIDNSEHLEEVLL